MIDSSQLCFTRAIEQPEFMGAFRCLYRSYHRRGLIRCSRAQQLRLTRYHLLPETRVLIARHGSRVVATLSLIEDRPLGVPLRSIFDAEVEAITGGEEPLAEAGCLAIDPLANVDGIYVVQHLMGLAAQAAIRRNIYRIVVAVHPRHAPFYQRIAGFQQFAGPAPHPGVAGAPAVGLQLNIEAMPRDNPAAWQRVLDMQFSAIALSTRPATPLFTRRLARLWQSLYDESGAAADQPGANVNPPSRMVAPASVASPVLTFQDAESARCADHYDYAASKAS
ncbi:MAG: hypothetical protein DCC67_15830 [Planctomycetota bacterium]|nr:MAG: hypothetical protein DCC67_15830 [Planctomycetota bacterium]